MLIEMERVCIYPKDVQIVIGKSERWERRLLKELNLTFLSSLTNWYQLMSFASTPVYLCILLERD
jgi:hypothetical protein